MGESGIDVRGRWVGGINNAVIKRGEGVLVLNFKTYPRGKTRQKGGEKE